MVSSSDPEMEYLSASFDPSTLTVPKLRGILMSHDIPYPASAKKSQLIDIFTQELIPKSRRILAARSRTRRTSKGITDMPSSQEGTVNGDEDNNASLMPPPPTPKRTAKKVRRVSSEDIEPSNSRRGSSGRKISMKHARPSDTETDPELEAKRPLVRKTRKSEVAPAVKIKEADDRQVRPSLKESPFSHENPFQSGSSPLLPGESRRRSAGTNGDRRKSTSRRRKTEGVSSPEFSRLKQEDGVTVPTSKTFEVPVARVNQPKYEPRMEPDDGIEAGEDFTPEEQLELVRARAANGDLDILPPRKKKRPQKTNLVPRSAPWMVIMALLSGYALWFRQEKLQVGYCGIGRSSDALSNVQIPEWASALQPTCELCPQHAYCYEGMETRCEQDFILKPHPLSLNGLIPLPPTCEPDGEKVRRVKAVADRAVEELRERKAKFECGTLTDGQGKATPTLEIPVETLKQEVAKKRRKGMSSAEFQDLWKGAIGEVLGREEVIHSVEGPTTPLLLATTSLARLPLACTIRRSTRLALARHRAELGLLTFVSLLLLYTRSYILALRSDSARVPALVSTTLDRLATQAALHARGEAPEGWVSVGQLRDDVLRDEFSAKRREGLWKRVKAVVEMNANVRASVREGRGGEVSRVWEWIGSLGIMDDSGRRESGRMGLLDDGGRRQSGRVSFGGVEYLGEGGSGRTSPAPGGRGEIVEARKWDEGRPIY